VKAVQARIIGAMPPLEVETPKELLNCIRHRLFRAYNEERLETPHEGIYASVYLEPRDKPGEHVIVGGIKDFARHRESARIVRDDGAWLHFTMTLRWNGKKSLEMLAYDFELVFPEGHVPPFVRFDFNKPGHDSEKKGMRSHSHPGNDDLQLPAPLMTPEELLDLFLENIRSRNEHKPRQ
jgi:hypothetical protein